jgi:hypothetical protein
MPTVAPPELPNLPSLTPDVSDYLRRLRAWAYAEIDKKIPTTEAVVQIMLAASDEKTPVHIFKLTVDHTGALHVTQIPLASPP